MLFTEIRDTGGRVILLSEFLELISRKLKLFGRKRMCAMGILGVVSLEMAAKS